MRENENACSKHKTKTEKEYNLATF